MSEVLAAALAELELLVIENQRLKAGLNEVNERNHELIDEGAHLRVVADAARDLLDHVRTSPYDPAKEVRLGRYIARLGMAVDVLDEPQSGDGPEYHADHEAWGQRQRPGHPEIRSIMFQRLVDQGKTAELANELLDLAERRGDEFARHDAEEIARSEMAKNGHFGAVVDAARAHEAVCGGTAEHFPEMSEQTRKILRTALDSLDAFIDSATNSTETGSRLVDDEVDMCGGCGKPATGFAELDGMRLCHGDDDPSPTCYEVGQQMYGLLPAPRKSFQDPERVAHYESVLRYISQPTMGYDGSSPPEEFALYQTGHIAARMALSTCIRMARVALDDSLVHFADGSYRMKRADIEVIDAGKDGA